MSVGQTLNLPETRAGVRCHDGLSDRAVHLDVGPGRCHGGRTCVDEQVSHILLAREDAGGVVGFCAFWHVLDELHVNNLAVAPRHRRTGVASALLTRVFGEAAQLGAKRVTLEVRRSNETAQRLYERFGFKVADVRVDYYSQPTEDALVLSLDLAAGR
ncbi:MAG: ribosomal-protein-alanine N-acetyltransferase [Acidobacteria bacterium]|nr:MAG: ribosomal-protein-alanine N-acetyltransferase [Acidobacteriota bacterium]